MTNDSMLLYCWMLIEWFFFLSLQLKKKHNIFIHMIHVFFVYLFCAKIYNMSQPPANLNVTTELYFQLNFTALGNVEMMFHTDYMPVFLFLNFNI